MRFILCQGVGIFFNKFKRWIKHVFKVLLLTFKLVKNVRKIYVDPFFSSSLIRYIYTAVYGSSILFPDTSKSRRREKKKEVS